MTTTAKANLMYDLMLIANDNDNSVKELRRQIAQVFEDITDQDLPENGYMVDEMAAQGLTETDFNLLKTLTEAYWTVRNG